RSICGMRAMYRPPAPPSPLGCRPVASSRSKGSPSPSRYPRARMAPRCGEVLSLSAHSEREGGPEDISITLVRHATLVIEINGLRLLVDPMLDPARARPPIENTLNDQRNPLVELPFDPLNGIDAILVTHLHQDHFDRTAAESLPRDVAVFCQPEDESQLVGDGLQATAISKRTEWRGLPIVRTSGQHGHGALAVQLAPVSGL